MPKTITVTCSSCGQPWMDGDSLHRCPMPPEIDFSRYTDEALQRLADHLALVLEGRRERLGS